MGQKMGQGHLCYRDRWPWKLVFNAEMHKRGKISIHVICAMPFDV